MTDNAIYKYYNINNRYSQSLMIKVDFPQIKNLQKLYRLNCIIINMYFTLFAFNKIENINGDFRLGLGWAAVRTKTDGAAY